MAGNPADLTIYKDNGAGWTTRDHTYYGRGCSNGWGTDGNGGSQTPCADSDAGGRFLKTADNEILKNGTYMNYQAATAGTGGAITTNNTDSSDTFCPLGWQLPYSGTGGDYYNKSRSWRSLFTTYNISFNDGSAADAVKIKSYPFSNIHSGAFYWLTGRLFFQSTRGLYWPSTSNSSTNGYALATWIAFIRPADSDSKALGFTLRCTL